MQNAMSALGHCTLSFKANEVANCGRPSRDSRFRGPEGAGLMITLRARPKRKSQAQGLGLR